MGSPPAGILGRDPGIYCLAERRWSCEGVVRFWVLGLSLSFVEPAS
jgi:hypothetical protein